MPYGCDEEVSILMPFGDLFATRADVIRVPLSPMCMEEGSVDTRKEVACYLFPTFDYYVIDPDDSSCKFFEALDTPGKTV